MNKRTLGSEKEKLAAAYLTQKGYDIIETNYRTRYEEIDIIAKDKNTIVFVEVKYRKNESFGNPLESITLNKQKRISMGAAIYLSNKNKSIEKTSIRFDAIGITGERITHIKDAFGYIGVGFR